MLPLFNKADIAVNGLRGTNPKGFYTSAAHVRGLYGAILCNTEPTHVSNNLITNKINKSPLALADH